MDLTLSPTLSLFPGYPCSVTSLDLDWSYLVPAQSPDQLSEEPLDPKDTLPGFRFIVNEASMKIFYDNLVRIHG